MHQQWHIRNWHPVTGMHCFCHVRRWKDVNSTVITVRWGRSALPCLTRRAWLLASDLSTSWGPCGYWVAALASSHSLLAGSIKLCVLRAAAATLCTLLPVPLPAIKFCQLFLVGSVLSLDLLFHFFPLLPSQLFSSLLFPSSPLGASLAASATPLLLCLLISWTWNKDVVHCIILLYSKVHRSTATCRGRQWHVTVCCRHVNWLTCVDMWNTRCIFEGSYERYLV